MADDLRMFVDGEWIPASDGEVFDAISPSTGEVIASVPSGTREDARRAVAAAGRSWEGWAARSAFDRAAGMRRVASAIDERREALAGPSPSTRESPFAPSPGRGRRVDRLRDGRGGRHNEGTNYWEPHLPFGGRGLTQRRRAGRRKVLDGASHRAQHPCRAPWRGVTYSRKGVNWKVDMP